MTEHPIFQATLEDHESRISDLEGWKSGVERTISDLTREVIATRAEGKERERVRSEETRETRQAITELTRQLAEQTGAQKAGNELERKKTQAWQRFGVVLGVLMGLGAMILSWQEVASYIWVDMLHLSEPWDTGGGK